MFFIYLLIFVLLLIAFFDLYWILRLIVTRLLSKVRGRNNCSAGTPSVRCFLAKTRNPWQCSITRCCQVSLWMVKESSFLFAGQLTSIIFSTWTMENTSGRWTLPGELVFAIGQHFADSCLPGLTSTSARAARPTSRPGRRCLWSSTEPASDTGGLSNLISLCLWKMWKYVVLEKSALCPNDLIFP